MKKIFSFFLLLLSITAYSQIAVTVDAGNVLKTLSGKENGINLNYLMDGSYLSPAISTTQSLKNVKAAMLRYPGGEKSDNYLFSSAPYTSSSPRTALLDTCYWPSNDARFVDTLSSQRLCKSVVLDFDEFITICNSVAASPLVVVAYDAIYNTRKCGGKPTKAQLITNAVEWVRYANIKKNYGVKYWMIGNESWNNSEYNGRVTPEKYAEDLKDFASAMKAVDPSIKIIANGRAGWWETLLTSNAVSFIDYLGLSEYPVFNYTGGYDYYLANDVNLTSEVDHAIEDINQFAPDQHKSRIKVIATEYNSIDWNNTWLNINNLGHALVNFQMFGDMIVKPKLEAACMWNTRWVLNNIYQQSIFDAFDSNGNLNANGTAMYIWGSNLLPEMVAAFTDEPIVKTYASYDDAAKKLNIFLLNKDKSSHQAKFSLAGYVDDFTGAVWQLQGTAINDKFPSFVRTDSIYEPEDIHLISLPPQSVTVISLQKDDVTLPVNLLRFEAKKNDTDITLNWLTADEKDLTEYIIERSSDGYVFTSIGTVKAKNIADSSLYAYTDTKVENVPVIYYRLVMQEKDGSKASSKVLSVILKDALQSLVVGPNPFNETIQIKISSLTEKNVSILLIDVSGKIVYTQKHKILKGTSSIELNNLNRLMKGMYMMKVGDDSGSLVAKVIKSW
ncbi:MAG TPA: T9SS type A sorting domain-containing protein [Flavitalea sp.]|nr:T9SS type A sorting domain-containing protein [Flavitalea sp.]